MEALESTLRSVERIGDELLQIHEQASSRFMHGLVCSKIDDRVEQRACRVHCQVVDCDRRRQGDREALTAVRKASDPLVPLFSLKLYYTKLYKIVQNK